MGSVDSSRSSETKRSIKVTYQRNLISLSIPVFSSSKTKKEKTIKSRKNIIIRTKKEDESNTKSLKKKKE